MLQKCPAVFTIKIPQEKTTVHRKGKRFVIVSYALNPFWP